MFKSHYVKYLQVRRKKDMIYDKTRNIGNKSTFKNSSNFFYLYWKLFSVFLSHVHIFCCVFIPCSYFLLRIYAIFIFSVVYLCHLHIFCSQSILLYQNYFIKIFCILLFYPKHCQISLLVSSELEVIWYLMYCVDLTWKSQQSDKHFSLDNKFENCCIANQFITEKQI